MKKEKLLSIVAAALIATSATTFSLALHNAGVGENEKNSIIQQTGAREEFEAFKENLKAELRNAYINKEITERQLNARCYEVDHLSFDEFVRKENPMTAEEKAEYDAINAFMATNFFAGLGITFGSATLGAAILYSQNEAKKQKKNAESNAQMGEIAEEPSKA